MFAIVPLLAGVFLGRFAPRRVAVTVQGALYLLAAAALIATSPQHHASHTSGVILALVLAPLAAASLLAGILWLRRTQPDPQQA